MLCVYSGWNSIIHTKCYVWLMYMQEDKLVNRVELVDQRAICSFSELINLASFLCLSGYRIVCWQAHYSTGAASQAFTSTVPQPVTRNDPGQSLHHPIPPLKCCDSILAISDQEMLIIATPARRAMFVCTCPLVMWILNSTVTLFLGPAITSSSTAEMSWLLQWNKWGNYCDWLSS